MFLSLKLGNTIFKKSNKNEIGENFDKELSQSFTFELISKLIRNLNLNLEIAFKCENLQKCSNKSCKISQNNSLIFNNIDPLDSPSYSKDNQFNFSLNFRPTSENKIVIENKDNCKLFLLDNKNTYHEINDLSFLGNNEHKRNLSNTNYNDNFNDTFKQLSEKVSFSKTANKSLNISPNRTLTFHQSLKNSNKETGTKAKDNNNVIYTTQTNINSTNNNSNPATENKISNPSKKIKNSNKLTKPTKSPIKTKIKKVSESKNEILSERWIYSKTNYIKNKELVEKIRKKLIESTINLANNSLKLKAKSQFKKNSVPIHLINLTKVKLK